MPLPLQNSAINIRYGPFTSFRNLKKVVRDLVGLSRHMLPPNLYKKHVRMHCKINKLTKAMKFVKTLYSYF